MKRIIIVTIFAALGISVNANAEYTQQTEKTTQSTQTRETRSVLPPETTVREVEVPGPVREVQVPGPVQVIKEPAPTVIIQPQ
jgi:hypothetical protein